MSAAALLSVALAWVGWRLVQQDERLAVQRVQERLDGVAHRMISLAPAGSKN